jgi:outer membrane biosynthesis protein TonB
MPSITTGPALHALLHGGGSRVDFALGAGLGGVGAAQYLYDSSDGRVGNSTVMGNVLVGMGVAGLGLVAARRIPAMYAESPAKARMAIGASLAGVALLGLAPLALADVPDGSDNLKAKQKGTPREIGKVERSTEGVAKPGSEPEIVDWSGKGAWHNERVGEFADAPNFILLHGTGGGEPGATKSQTAESLLSTFTNAERQVSAHYVVGRDGKIIEYVDPRERAWHAAGDGRDWNSAAIGIEIVNDNSGKDEYTDAQLEAVRSLVQHLSHEFEIPATHVYAHRQVQDDRSDPVGFPFKAFLDVLDDTEPMKGRVPNLDGQAVASDEAEGRTPDRSEKPEAEEKPKAQEQPKADEPKAEEEPGIAEAPAEPVEPGAPMIDAPPAPAPKPAAPKEQAPPKQAAPKETAPTAPAPQPEQQHHDGGGITGAFRDVLGWDEPAAEPERADEAAPAVKDAAPAPQSSSSQGSIVDWLLGAFG